MNPLRTSLSAHSGLATAPELAPADNACDARDLAGGGSRDASPRSPVQACSSRLGAAGSSPEGANLASPLFESPRGGPAGNFAPTLATACAALPPRGLISLGAAQREISPPRLPLRVLRCPPRGLISLGAARREIWPPRLPLRVLRCPPRGLISLGAAQREISPPRLPLRVLRCPPRGLISLGAAQREISPPRLPLPGSALRFIFDESGHHRRWLGRDGGGG